MLTLSHSDDGVIKVEDKAAGFSATVNISADAGKIDQLIDALRFAAQMAPQPAKQGKPVRKPRVARQPAGEAAAEPAASERTQPKAGYVPTLSEVILEVLNDKPMTLAALIERPKVMSAVSSPDEKRRRASVAAALTRLERAGTIVNVADSYKRKA